MTWETLTHAGMGAVGLPPMKKLAREGKALLSAVDNYCYPVYGEVMNVHLGPAFDEFVAELLKSGYYQTQSEVLREGLRLLKEREEVKQLRLAELRKEIAAGAEQADRGQFVDGPKAFAKVRQRSAQRKRSKR